MCIHLLLYRSLFIIWASVDLKSNLRFSNLEIFCENLRNRCRHHCLSPKLHKRLSKRKVMFSHFLQNCVKREILLLWRNIKKNAAVVWFSVKKKIKNYHETLFKKSVPFHNKNVANWNKPKARISQCPYTFILKETEKQTFPLKI